MKKNLLVAAGVAVFAAVLSLASMADYAFPGVSAHLMALWKGLETGATEYPLMAACCRILGGGNLIAPISAVVASVSLFVLVSVGISTQVKSDYRLARKYDFGIAAGVTAVVVFLLTPAVRGAATHLDPKLFDLAWLLAMLALFLPFFAWKKGTALMSLLLGVLAGFSFCDSALILAFLPFFFAIIVIAARNQSKKPYLSLFLFLLVGFVTAIVAMNVFGMTVQDHLRRIASEMRIWRSVPGWLFVTVFSLIPFLVALFAMRKAFESRPTLVQSIFHTALTFVSVLAIATPVAPSSLLEPYGMVPAATSAFAAAVAGYLIAYWWCHRKVILSVIAGGVFAFVLIVTCLWNLFSFDGDRGAFADKVAHQILADLGDRQWFVSDGTLDNHIKLVADKEGKKVHVISLARDLDSDYLERLGELVAAEKVGGAKNAELRVSVSLGVLPFLQDWIAADPSATREIAVWGAPDLWYSAHQTPVPEFFFFGADESRVPDWSMWKSFDVILHAPKGWGSYHDRNQTDPVDRLRFALRRHLGFVANNRGVWLQDKHRDDDAWKMYELVLNEIDRDNICTVFNEVAMIGANHPSAVAKRRDLERMLKAAVDDTKRRYILWRLGTYYGYIRNPDTFVRLGHAWARSGRPGDALAQIRRAIDFVPTESRMTLLNMMASLYASENNVAKSRSIYESVLAKNNDDHDALIGLMRIELEAGNTKKALEYLERAVAISKASKRPSIDSTMLALMKNDLNTAAALAQKAVDADNASMKSWSILAAVVMQQIDATKDAKAKAALEKRLEYEILPAMEKRSTSASDYYLQSTKGFLYLRKGEKHRQKARDAFAAAAKKRPDVAMTHDLVLGLDISLDDKQNAEVHARDVLQKNRNAPLANYVMGSLALGRGKYSEAEIFLRKAVASPRPNPLAMNDLAEVLRRGKNFSEAERFARAAVAAAPELYVAWETLGSVLMDAGRDLAEAESCIRKACELSKEKNGREADIRMLISLARVQIRANDRQHAKVTIRKVQARIAELSEFEKKEFEEVKKSAR